MKIVNVIGGLGNQMFQCALAIALQKEYPEEKVYIDTSHFKYIFLKKVGPINMHNGYEIDSIFKDFSMPVADKKHIRKIGYYLPNFLLSRIIGKRLPTKKTMYIEKENFRFYDEVLNMKGDVYYDGYWQCAKYFEKYKQEVIKAFSFPALNTYSQRKVNEISGCESVAIHVRRGDFLKDPEFGGICGKGYFADAISCLLKEKKQYKFFVFSNDIAWCKEHIAPLVAGNEIVYVDGNRGKECVYDMYLMSQCKHMIVSNSSFSWWGAFFNTQGGHIVAPRPWVDRDIQTDNYGSDWIVIDAHDRKYNKFIIK